jgi:amino acid transporter
MAGDGPRLSRELNIWEAVGISVALMAPSMAANINPQGVIGSVGRAVPLTFALATVGVLLVSYTFVRLTQKFHHSGSVYGFVGATLGPRGGVVAGWGLLGTYVFYGVVTSMAAGRIFTAFLESVGILHSPSDLVAFVVALLSLAAVLVLTISPVKRGTRILLIAEAATVLLIIIVSLIVLARLASGNAPGGRTVTFTPFSVEPGIDGSALFLGVVFGFLSFAGFEAAATLGEEAKEPRRDIPRAILGTALFGGLYFIFVTWVEVQAFGTDDAGQKAFGASGSLLGDLGSQYVGSWVGDLISLGASVSAFACALACAVGASRLLYALSRDGVMPASLAAVSPTSRAPYRAAYLVVAAMAVIEIMLGIAYRGDDAPSFSVFANSGVIGTLILLVAYVLATLGAIRLLFFSGDTSTPRWEMAVPLLALAVLGYTLYRNVVPYPSGEMAWLPALGALWLLAAVVLVLVKPDVARRAGALLMADEGLARSPEATDTGAAR